MDQPTSIRIINVDYYMCAPRENFDALYSDFRGSSTGKVPVIRIFGATDTGRKICLHVHKIFPYVYIPYSGHDDPNRLAYQIAAELDKNINISFGQATSNAQHVYKVTLVSGTPMYGYHAKQHQFFKISLYNPFLIRRAVNLLTTNTLLGQMYQPHEAHVPYILQFMIDYNLHGMSFIHLSEVKYRENRPEGVQTQHCNAHVSKESYCEFEADCVAENILNRLEVASGKVAVNPGIAALWEEEKQRRRNKNRDSQIGPCLSLENLNVKPTNSHNVFKRALRDRLAILQDEIDTTDVTSSSDVNSSVYPAETPKDCDVLEASSIEHAHESSFNCSALNESSENPSDVTLGDNLDAVKLYEILKELQGVTDDKEHLEEDSVLSQIVQEEDDDEEMGEEKEKDQDLSVTMQQMTPIKVIIPEDNNCDDVIPQLDGNDDDEEDFIAPKRENCSKVIENCIKQAKNLSVALIQMNEKDIRSRNLKYLEESTLKRKPKKKPQYFTGKRKKKCVRKAKLVQETTLIKENINLNRNNIVFPGRLRASKISSLAKHLKRTLNGKIVKRSKKKFLKSKRKLLKNLLLKSNAKSVEFFSQLVNSKSFSEIRFCRKPKKEKVTKVAVKKRRPKQKMTYVKTRTSARLLSIQKNETERRNCNYEAAKKIEKKVSPLTLSTKNSDKSLEGENYGASSSPSKKEEETTKNINLENKTKPSRSSVKFPVKIKLQKRKSRRVKNSPRAQENAETRPEKAETSPKKLTPRSERIAMLVSYVNVEKFNKMNMEKLLDGSGLKTPSPVELKNMPVLESCSTPRISMLKVKAKTDLKNILEGIKSTAAERKALRSSPSKETLEPSGTRRKRKNKNEVNGTITKQTFKVKRKRSKSLTPKQIRNGLILDALESGKRAQFVLKPAERPYVFDETSWKFRHKTPPKINILSNILITPCASDLKSNQINVQYEHESVKHNYYFPIENGENELGNCSTEIENQPQLERENLQILDEKITKSREFFNKYRKSYDDFNAYLKTYTDRGSLSIFKLKDNFCSTNEKTVNCDELVTKLQHKLLDGANDSSSSDEEYKNRTKSKINTKRIKSGRKLRGSPRYQPLPIISVSPSRNKQDFPGSKGRDFSNKSNQKRLQRRELQEEAVAAAKKEPHSNLIDKVKRKISFVNSSFNETKVEEKLECKLKKQKPVRKSTRLIEKIEKNETACTSKKGDAPDCDISKPEKFVYDAALAKDITVANQNVNKAKNKNIVTFKNDEALSRAERYDIENNYLPVEGSSKDCCIVVSQKSLDQQEQLFPSSGSTADSTQLDKNSTQFSSDFPPNQEVLLNKKTLSQSSDSSSFDFPLGQEGFLDETLTQSGASGCLDGLDYQENSTTKKKNCGCSQGFPPNQESSGSSSFDFPPNQEGFLDETLTQSAGSSECLNGLDKEMKEALGSSLSQENNITTKKRNCGSSRGFPSNQEGLLDKAPAQSPGSSGEGLLDKTLVQSGSPDYLNGLDEEVKQTVRSCSLLNQENTTTMKKICAPTRQMVIDSLISLNIPSVKNEEPFYGNVEDVTAGVEVGLSVLKITNQTAAYQQDFESTFDALNSFRKAKLQTLSMNLKWSFNNLKTVKLTFCKNADCRVTPALKPPTRNDVKNWIKQQNTKHLNDQNPKSTTKKATKIYIPLSPGGDDSDLDLSLTLTPCTPVNSQGVEINSDTPPSTPKTSLEESPIIGNKNKRRKLQLDKTQTLRKSLLTNFSQNMSNFDSSRISGVSKNNTFGFNNSVVNLQKARALSHHQHLTILVTELHIRTRGEFKPNPEYDSIRAVFYCVTNDVPENVPNKPQKTKGVIAINSIPVSPTKDNNKYKILDGTGGTATLNITYVQTEEELINSFVEKVRECDPDIIAGYEIEMLSLGYLIERAFVLGINLPNCLSRIKEAPTAKNEDLQITGRIVLDVWRLMRHEIALRSYSFENIYYHVFQKRVPKYSFKDLSFWWDHRYSIYRHQTVNYYTLRVEGVIQLFDKLDLINRTSELAKLFGIQFYEVLSRGSQFRVESMMLRLAKPNNFIPVSPSVAQRAKMRAPEFLPLIMEPESKLYVDPVIVLDFQSLYPSMIIAYNYCFTTCLGRVQLLGKNAPFEFGATQLKVSRNRVNWLLQNDKLNISPCGMAFVKPEIRDGILPRMLREILETRLMVKNSMKENRDDSLLQKVLHSRQLGLKLIANVTYGYTAANFSGRMPSVEVGDSVVSKGRETLQRAIAMVNETKEWGARVVYGDTDSLFVIVPGKSKEDAFAIGQKIADAVTNDNPNPVKLKLEKVFYPCILQTKKRYVGYMYESKDQKEPLFLGKGIETVRRDGCSAVAKILEKCLRMLFETKNVSLIKQYVTRQFNKILTGRVNIQDLTFSKEYRGASNYRPGACVPALELARKWTAVDKRNEPRKGERVPYIIINGPPGIPLIRLVRSPCELLNDPSLRPNALYYITKVIIPPINRCFNLIGADLNAWFAQMPRKLTQYLPSTTPSPGKLAKKFTISQYFVSTSCACCGTQTQNKLCENCCSKPQSTGVTLMEKVRHWEQSYYTVKLICESCSGTVRETNCISLDCPVLYRLSQTSRDLQQAPYIREIFSEKLLEF